MVNNKVYSGLPEWLSGESLPANAGGACLIPGLGRIPHAEEQLSPCVIIAEPVLYSPPWEPQLQAHVPQLRKPLRPRAPCSVSREAAAGSLSAAAGDEKPGSLQLENARQPQRCRAAQNT